MKSLNGAAMVAAWSALAVGGAVHAQEAVQWRVEDGGNGHWYVGVAVDGGVSWTDAKLAAELRGGHLATPRSSPENEWVFATIANTPELFPNQYGPWIGVYQDPEDPGFFEPNGGWRFVTGEAVEGGLWAPGEPNNAGAEHFAHYGGWEIGSGWNDLDDAGQGNKVVYVRGYLLEFSADCNGDGIVDYGQILDGSFPDADDNGVPDCCDEGVPCEPCVGDVNVDGIVDGADISVLLSFWGPNGTPNNADTNDDGRVDGSDLANVLSSWGECP